MSQKPILVPARLRRPPATGWSWMDRRFVFEHMAHLSREAVLLYFFLAAVADKHGLSFYADSTLANGTRWRSTAARLVASSTRAFSSAYAISDWRSRSWTRAWPIESLFSLRQRRSVSNHSNRPSRQPRCPDLKQIRYGGESVSPRSQVQKNPTDSETGWALFFLS